MSETFTPPEDEFFESPALLAEDAILFPEMEVTMTVHDSKNVAAATQAFRERKLLVLIPASRSDVTPGSIGTLVHIQKMDLSRTGGAQLLSRGLWRVRVQKAVANEPYVRVRFARADGSDEVGPDGSKVMNDVRAQIDEFVRLMPRIPPEILAFLKSIDTPGRLSDICAYSPFFTFEEKLDLLKTLDAEVRLAKVNVLFQKQLSKLRAVSEIRTIPDCSTCNDLADRAFEQGSEHGEEIASEFLDHVIREHRDEVLGVLIERYGPLFLRKRALK